MSARWRFPRPRTFASPEPDRRRLVDRRFPHLSSGPKTGEPALADAAAVPFGTAVDGSALSAQVSRCRKEPDSLATRRRQTPTCPGNRLSHGIPGHLDVLYALAYLSSGQ